MRYLAINAVVPNVISGAEIILRTTRMKFLLLTVRGNSADSLVL